MSDKPPFHPGQVVWTDWLKTDHWEPVEVERCERAPHATQTGWLVWIKGGLPSSASNPTRVACFDAGWFRTCDPRGGIKP